MKNFDILSLISGICIGVVLVSMVSAMLPKSKNKIPTPQATQWIGRFVAGDGDGRIFSAPMIELGLRSDGVIAWRTKQPEPFSLISTQRAEAK